jgi:hypothetical protein
VQPTKQGRPHQGREFRGGGRSLGRNPWDASRSSLEGASRSSFWQRRRAKTRSMRRLASAAAPAVPRPQRQKPSDVVVSTARHGRQHGEMGVARGHRDVRAGIPSGPTTSDLQTESPPSATVSARSRTSVSVRSYIEIAASKRLRPAEGRTPGPRQPRPSRGCSFRGREPIRPTSLRSPQGGESHRVRRGGRRGWVIGMPDLAPGSTLRIRFRRKYSLSRTRLDIGPRRRRSSRADTN